MAATADAFTELLAPGETTTPTSATGCLHELFEAQVACDPQRTALVTTSERLTYGELNARANRLAHRLRHAGVNPETRVGVFLQRSSDLIVAILGILKAGGAYVPLDPAYPVSRLAFMLGDSETTLVVTQAALRDALTNIISHLPAAPAVLSIAEADLAGTDPSPNPPPAAGPTNLAYVIYTSGSTGQPKGVALEHRNAVSFVRWAGHWFRPDELDGVLASTSICFDVSMFETLTTLGLGGRVILAANALELPTLPARSEVRMIVTSPSVMREILRMGPLPASVMSCALAGEALDVPLVRQLYDFPHLARVYDLYGPTETTTYSTAVIRSRDGPSTIGRPIEGTQIHLVNETLAPVAAGEPGEIIIAGHGVARGYLNRPELTAQRFLPDPKKPGARMYRTGDLGRWLPDGQLQYLGRIDHQVKIHGFRIELGEIETVLRGHPGVHEAVVVAREDHPGQKRLVAYVVARQPDAGADRLRRDLRLHLQQSLPEYMVPGTIVVLDRMPLNPNGKIDRAALPRPTYPTVQETPATPTEATLCRLWADGLHLPAVGMEDEFRLLGGDSLVAVKLMLAVEKEFGVKLPAETLVNASTIRALARLLDNRGDLGARPLLMLQRGSRAPLYLVHGIGGGMIWGYTNLARSLDPLQPVIVFQAPAGQATRPDTLVDIAASYVRELRSFQPDGPYHLGGFCFGGNVAFEMARQLSAAGAEPGLLVLINSTPPNSDYECPIWDLRQCGRFAANVGRWFGEYVKWDAADRRRYLVWRIQHAAGRVFAPALSCFDRQYDVDLNEVPRECHSLWQAHLAAQAGYQPLPYAGTITLLRTRAHQFRCSFARDFGWGPYARGGVRVRIVPGLHQNMLRPPNVVAVARELESCLREHRVADPA